MCHIRFSAAVQMCSTDVVVPIAWVGIKSLQIRNAVAPQRDNKWIANCTFYLTPKHHFRLLIDFSFRYIGTITKTMKQKETAVNWSNFDRIHTLHRVRQWLWSTWNRATILKIKRCRNDTLIHFKTVIKRYKWRMSHRECLVYLFTSTFVINKRSRRPWVYRIPIATKNVGYFLEDMQPSFTPFHSVDWKWLLKVLLLFVFRWLHRFGIHAHIHSIDTYLSVKWTNTHRARLLFVTSSHWKLMKSCCLRMHTWINTGKHLNTELSFCRQIFAF